jgi:pre-mRNA-processing factor SLU7
MDDLMSDSDLGDSSDDDLKDVENKDAGDNDKETKNNPRVKTMNMNLRSRDQTAKYLINLNSKAHYDGKSRAMRENPNEEEEEASEEKDKNLFKGDNKNIYSGQFLELMDQSNFTTEAKEKGNIQLNNVAMPSQAELAFKHYKEKKANLNTKMMNEMYEKYGGQEHADMPDDVKMAQIEERYEMVERAKEAKKAKKVNLKVRSKYEEDVLINGHTKVWGSFWHEKLGWGYKC